MPPIYKPIVKLAVAIHTELGNYQRRDELVELPMRSWQRCAELVRQIRRAQLRSWRLAAKTLLNDLRCTIPSLLLEVTAMQEKLPTTVATNRLATANDIYQDLVALDNEFDELNYDKRVRHLSVTTEPIVLEGVYLGPFEIRLQWAQPVSGEAPAYRVIARDPHPAESRENVAHPHVMDEVLCEGDGRHAIRQALSQGRLLDFFTLVAGILRNYNPESPFVELAMWYGSSCSDCGAALSKDESNSCQECCETLCCDCETVCCGCDDNCCAGCIRSCRACDDNYCRNCLRPCHGCQARVCSSCLDENERCLNCHEEESPEARTSHSESFPNEAAV